MINKTRSQLKISHISLATKVNVPISVFEWNPNLPVVVCVWEGEQIGIYRIKHDTKKWLYQDAILMETDGEHAPAPGRPKTAKHDDSDADSDSSVSTSGGLFDLKSKKTKDEPQAMKVIHINWLNEGNTLYYATSYGQVKFFDFSLTENQLRLAVILEIKDHLSSGTEVYFDQHSSIYLASTRGLIYSVNEQNEVARIIQLNSPILRMIYFKRKSKFIVISEEFTLHQYSLQNQNNAQQLVELSAARLEVFNRSFNPAEKLTDKRKAKKNKSKGAVAQFRQEDVFFLKIDEHFGIIGICIVGERVIRLFQVNSGQNLAVIAIESTDYQWSGVSSLIYSETLQLLLAGTSNNQFLVWKRSAHSSEGKELGDAYGKQFEFNKMAQFSFEGTINGIAVSKNEKIAVVSGSSSICMIEKQILNFIFLNGLAVIQVNARELRLIWLNSAESEHEQMVSIGENVKEVFLSASLNKLAIRTNKSTELIVLELKPDRRGFEVVKTLQVRNHKLILQDGHVWQLNLDLNKSKTLTNNQGLSMNCYSLTDRQDEQQICAIDLEQSFKSNERIQLSVLDCNGGHLLIVVQSESLVQNYCYLVYELNQNEATPKCRPTLILVDDQIMEAKINSNGTLLAIVDGTQVYLAATGSDELRLVKLSLPRIDQIHFASNEPRLLAIQSEGNLFVLICYVQEKVGYQLYERKQINVGDKLIGFQVPHIYVLSSEENLQIIKETFKEFDEISIEVVRLIIDFLTDKRDLNLMIKKINRLSQRDGANENLWLNLARISVKCRNVEMGLYCMGRLKNVRVIRDVKNELRDKNASGEVKNSLALAVLAMNLNLFQEAEELFKSSDHNLKLVQYYQCRNDWPIALKTIEKLNERSVFYDCAKYYENEMNDIEMATRYYELSNNFEVGRMLFDLNELGKLKHYCLNGSLPKGKSKEKAIKADADRAGDEAKSEPDEYEEKRRLNALKGWWARYCESLGDFQSALKAYEQAKDYYNQVRLLCLIGNLEGAKKLVNLKEEGTAFVKTFDTDAVAAGDELNFLAKHNRPKLSEQELERQSKNAAMLHLAQQLESVSPAEAVQHYLTCGAINQAIKVCKLNQFDEQLSKIIQNYGSKSEIIELLKKLDESEENYELLFNLYLKIEMIDKGLRMAFAGRLWPQLRSFLNRHLDKVYKSANEDAEKAPDGAKKLEISDETIEVALEYLKSNSQIIDIVIDMLLIKGGHKSLIKDLILDYKIDINNELIEKIEKIEPDETNSKSLLQSLAESALIQGKYLISAKLFNSTNDRVNSIKSLVRLGDVQRVINYANISRDKSVYKIAASFLQTTQGNEKTIEMFYKKAGIKREKVNL